MTQEDLYDILKENPYFEFTPRNLLHELKAKKINMNLQSIYRALRSLSKQDDIKKTKKGFYYEPTDGKRKLNKILYNSN